MCYSIGVPIKKVSDAGEILRVGTPIVFFTDKGTYSDMWNVERRKQFEKNTQEAEGSRNLFYFTKCYLFAEGDSKDEAFFVYTHFV